MPCHRRPVEHCCRVWHPVVPIDVLLCFLGGCRSTRSWVASLQTSCVRSMKQEFANPPHRCLRTAMWCTWCLLLGLPSFRALYACVTVGTHSCTHSKCHPWWSRGRCPHTTGRSGCHPQSLLPPLVASNCDSPRLQPQYMQYLATALHSHTNTLFVFVPAPRTNTSARPFSPVAFIEGHRHWERPSACKQCMTGAPRHERWANPHVPCRGHGVVVQPPQDGPQHSCGRFDR